MKDCNAQQKVQRKQRKLAENKQREQLQLTTMKLCK